MSKSCMPRLFPLSRLPCLIFNPAIHTKGTCGVRQNEGSFGGVWVVKNDIARTTNN